MASPMPAGGFAVRFALPLLVAVAVAAMIPPGMAAAEAGRAALTFTPVADAYVDAAKPDASFGTETSLWVDASSAKQAFIKFSLSQVSGRTITAARLRLYQSDASPSGGRVWALGSNDWTESVTWNTRPVAKGTLLASFGAVGGATWYELELPVTRLQDGPVTLAMDSLDADGARWRSREHANAPQLTLELGPHDGDTFEFTPEADASVNASTPDAASPTGSLWVDASPERQSFLRFDLRDLTGRTIVGARLRVYQVDASGSGGRVWALSDSTWSESVTWNTRPAIDGRLLGSFGSVASGSWYETELDPSALPEQGLFSVALDSTSTDGAAWAAREAVQVSRLLVDVARVPGLTVDGLSEVTNDYLGSSDPTAHGSTKRLAVSSGGRLLAVHGRHRQGVQLAWRDPGGGWRTATRGEVSDGLLLSGTGTGDWMSSLVVGRDPAGAEHAWVVWAGHSAQSTAPIQLRRLSGLDDPAGPAVGPIVNVSGTGIGNAKVDLAFETPPSGPARGVIAWVQRTDAGTWSVATTWFTDLLADAPAFHDPATLLSAAGGGRYPTVVGGPGGARVVIRDAAGGLRVFGHDTAAPLGTWWAGAAADSVDAAAAPSAVSLTSGEVLAALEAKTATHLVRVVRYAASGAAAGTDLEATGYDDPTLVTDGTRLLLVMVRTSDGFVVSRSFAPATGWSASDRVEIGAEGGGGYEWPNALRDADGRLRLVVRGPAASEDQASVLAFQRSL